MTKFEPVNQILNLTAHGRLEELEKQYGSVKPAKLTSFLASIEGQEFKNFEALDTARRSIIPYLDPDENYFYWYVFKDQQLKMIKKDNIWALIRLIQNFEFKRNVGTLSLLALYRYCAIEGQKQDVSQGPYYYGLLLMSSTLDDLLYQKDLTIDELSDELKESVFESYDKNTFAEKLVKRNAEDNTRSLVSRLECLSYFEAIKWLEIGKQMGDIRRCNEALQSAYDYVGNISKSLEFEHNNPLKYEDDLVVIKNLFRTIDGTELEMKSFDKIHIFETYLYEDLISIPLKEFTFKDCKLNRAVLYEKLLVRYKELTTQKVGVRAKKLDIINSLLYLIADSHDHRQIKHIICCFQEPTSLAVIAERLIKSHPVFFRYGLYLLTHLVREEEPKACLPLSQLYTSGYSNEGDKYHPRGQSITENKRLGLQLAKKAYNRGYVYWNREAEPNEDYKKYFFGFSKDTTAEVKRLFYQRYDCLSSQIKLHSETMKPKEQVDLFLDFLHHNPQGVITNYQAALFFLFEMDDINSGLFYLRKGAECNNIEAKQLLHILELLGYDITDENSVLKPCKCSEERYDYLYQRWLVR